MDKEYREEYKAKLVAEGFVCKNHPDKPATSRKTDVCHACYSAQRWANDPEYRKSQNTRHAAWVEANRTRANQIAKKWRDLNPEKHREAVRKSRAKRLARQEVGNNE